MLIFAASLALLAAGCSSSDSDDSAGDTTAGANASTPAQGGSLTFAIDTPLTTFDPNVAAAAQDARVMRQIYDSLVAVDGDEIVPWLATGWEVSDDGTTYRFTLRDDVTFHDGTTFDAAAVCSNLDRITDPATASVFAIGAIGPYDSCTAEDPTTAVITLSAPYAPLLANLSSPFLGITSPTAVAELGAAEFAVNPVGSGPFRFVSYTPNDRIVLKANEDYAWAPANAEHSGAPYLDDLTFQIIPDGTVRLGSLRNGSVQAIGNVPEAEAATLQGESGIALLRQAQSGGPYQLFFNQDHPPFDEPEVRRAIRQALDVDAVVEALYFGVYERAWSPLSPSTNHYSEDVEGSWEADPDAAADALDELGWSVGANGVRAKGGQELRIRYIEGTPNREKRQDIAEFFSEALQDVGIAVTTEFRQGPDLQNALRTGQYDFAGLSLVNVDANVMFNEYHSRFIPTPDRLGFNLGRVNDPALDARLLQAQQAPDDDERKQLYADLQQEVVDKAYSIPVYVPTFTVGTNGLSGIRFDAEGYPVIYDAFLGE